MKKSFVFFTFLIGAITASASTTQKITDHLRIEGNWCKGNYELVADQGNKEGSWHWTLNGVTLEEETESHVNMSRYGLGKYEVSFISTSDELILKDSFDLNVLPGPKADFGYDYFFAAASVQFTNMTTSNESDLTWTWDFGDGNTSNKQNPTHMYKDEGTYLVQLTATNQNGCSNTVSTEIDWRYPKN